MASEIREEGSSERKPVFVTVGTTSFDALIRVVDSPEFGKLMLRKGYNSLIIQYGRGKYVPNVPPEGVWRGPLHVVAYTFKPSLTADMRRAQLVISHAGSGSIFESLRLYKPLLVVINEALMDNHQQELAHELAAGGFCGCCLPESVLEELESLEPARLKPYPPADARPFARALDDFMGVAV